MPAFSREGGMFCKLCTYQHVPDIFVGPIEAAKTNADPQKALAAPHIAGSHRRLPELQCLAAVDQHLHRLLHVCFQQVLEGVIVFILGGGEGMKQQSFQLQLLSLLLWLFKDIYRKCRNRQGGEVDF